MIDLIALDIRPDGAVFRFGDNDERLLGELDALIERYETGQVKPARYVTALREFVTRHPACIEASAHLALALLDQEKPRQAQEAAQRAFKLGEKAIPADYRGEIDWRHESNRSFLQVADALARAHAALGEPAQALAVMEKMLAWNPGDHQGVALRIGALYLRTGRKNEAKAAFEAALDHDGTAHYELGLMHLMDGDFVAAATALRRGFVDTPYVAELLCGAASSDPYMIGDAIDDVEHAMDYAESEYDAWRKTDQALLFLRWLFHHPRAMMERAAIFDLREQRRWEKDLNARDRLEQREEASIAQIDDALSVEIVREREDQAGRRAMPWMHLAAQAPPEDEARAEPAWMRLT